MESRSKICNKCGSPNSIDAESCSSCGSERFAPSWVVAKGIVNRQVSVEITRSNPKYGKSERRVTLSKWWPGGNSSFHIPSPDQWEMIQKIINTQLAPILCWRTKQNHISDITKQVNQGSMQFAEYQDLFEKHPDFLRKLVESINPEELSKKDFNRVIEIFGEISDALTNANAGFREAFLGLLKKLPSQKERALEDLSLLLEGWSLHVITNVAQQVRARIETISLFEEQVQNPNTYEILGDNSIHRILERSMWMIDERYWLMQSNKTLRHFIGNEMQKRDIEKYGQKRPDFVCGTVDSKLIILELKRPSHSLKVEDLNQLETYSVVAEDYLKFSSFEGYLIGARKDAELERYLKRRKGMRVLFYSDIIGSIKTRYHEFLKTIEEQ